MKKEYIPPILEINEYMVEHGYAGSISVDPDSIIMDVSDPLENVTEGENYDLFGDDTWF